ncbi:MAG: uracil-DNA glycosylase, partial [Beijerinckiaceae bacterium]
MDAATDPNAAIKALLAWYVDAGVDMAFDETPHDRFTPRAAEPVTPMREAGRTATPPRIALPLASAPPAPEEAAADARQRATSAKTLEELEALLRDFDGCALKATASRLVFADGTPGARVMLVGEAPGADEDREGRPFVGRSGQLLDRMLAAINLTRRDVYVANIIPWRPPGNRTPTPQ